MTEKKFPTPADVDFNSQYEDEIEFLKIQLESNTFEFEVSRNMALTEAYFRKFLRAHGWSLFTSIREKIDPEFNTRMSVAVWRVEPIEYSE